MVNQETQDRNGSESQAQAQLDGIKLMVKRLEHAQQCNGDDCELTDAEMLDGLEYLSGPETTKEEREQYHDEDAARDRIQEAPLSVQVRSGWYPPGDTPEAEEYEILLCTGGPAVRIIGRLGAYNQPDSARLQHQDWFTPWQELITTGEDQAALLSYAGAFYFGE